MTEKEIIKALVCWLDPVKYPFQMANAYFYGWECDYWAMDPHGITREFEIKVTRSDFKGDAKKPKHENTANGANYFYYVTPANLVKAEEVPRDYGLIWVAERSLIIVKKPRRLHSTLFDGWKELARKTHFRYRETLLEKMAAREISFQQYRDCLVLEWAEKENKCEQCEETMLEKDCGRVCAYHLNDQVTDYKNYPICNCCDNCRKKCMG